MGAAEHHVRLSQLHQPAQVQHGDPVGDVSDHAEIVRDEQVRHLLVALQPDQQVQDRRLDRDVEGGRRFVAQDQSRITGERSRDGHALLQPA